jgi:hypothetical protein
VWTGFIRLGIGSTSAHGGERSGSLEREECVDKPTSYHISRRILIHVVTDQVKEDEIGRACMGEKNNVYTGLMRNSEGKRPLENLDVGGRIILKLILDK